MPAPTTFALRSSGESDIVYPYGYPTDLIRVRRGVEQRIQLREWPVAALEWPFRAESAIEQQVAENLIYDAQGKLLGVPQWQWAQPLAGGCSLGETAFTIADADSVPWPVTPSWVLIYNSPIDFEVLEFASASGTTVNTVDGAGYDRPPGTLLAPVIMGRMDGDHRGSRSTIWTVAAPIRFALEPTQFTAGTWPAGSYLSRQVLEIPPSGPELGPDATSRLLLVQDPVTGPIDVERPSVAPDGLTTMTWICESRAAIRQLLAFLDDRKGRAVPFWMPSWREDLSLFEDAHAGASSIHVVATGYGDRVYPAGPYRRHLALRTPAGALVYRKATSLTPGGDVTETIGFGSTLGAEFPKATSRIMHLLLVRLEQDTTRIEFVGGLGGSSIGLFARATFQVRELSEEVPA